MEVINGKISSLVKKEKIKIDPIGKWLAYPVSNGQKTIIFITLYRILQSLNNGIYKSVSQYNLIKGEVNTAALHRKSIFKEILKYVNEQEEINDIVIGEDFN